MTDVSKLEAKVEGHEVSIHSITLQVSKLATMFEYTEKDRAQERETTKEIANVLKSLDKRMDEMGGFGKEVAQCKEDIRLIRHDVDNIQNTQRGLVSIVQDVTELKVTVKNLETLRLRM